MAKGTLSFLNFQRMALSSFQLRMVLARTAELSLSITELAAKIVKARVLTIDAVL